MEMIRALRIRPRQGLGIPDSITLWKYDQREFKLNLKPRNLIRPNLNVKLKKITSMNISWLNKFLISNVNSTDFNLQPVRLSMALVKQSLTVNTLMYRENAPLLLLIFTIGELEWKPESQSFFGLIGWWMNLTTAHITSM